MCYNVCCKDCEASSRCKCCCGCCLVDVCEWWHHGPCNECLNCCCCRLDDPNQAWNKPNRCCCGLCWNPCTCCSMSMQDCRRRCCTFKCWCCVCDPCACCFGEYKGDIRHLEREMYQRRRSSLSQKGAPQNEESMDR